MGFPKKRKQIKDHKRAIVDRLAALPDSIRLRYHNAIGCQRPGIRMAFTTSAAGKLSDRPAAIVLQRVVQARIRALLCRPGANMFVCLLTRNC
jgi:hypothetical protein